MSFVEEEGVGRCAGSALALESVVELVPSTLSARTQASFGCLSPVQRR